MIEGCSLCGEPLVPSSIAKGFYECPLCLKISQTLGIDVFNWVEGIVLGLKGKEIVRGCILKKN